jgi:hypothetical protein
LCQPVIGGTIHTALEKHRKMRIRFIALSATLFVAFLAGCATQTKPTATPQPTVAQTEALKNLNRTYDAGNYGDVIQQIAGSTELNSAPEPMQVEALKLKAFSYCLSKYPVLCRDTFRQILRIEPGFTLTPTEQGHPLWGPAYQTARGK